ncbi:MAG: hypothetical protein OHK93_004612 [Ramalina farinacea]|uniref:DUF6594 domain-containing protein n=1 Tax=Ramalina farinacea TaxID=258253 RepID=A0AA43QWD8_9LECA|nr:hypothetical protein [Ramalina farinacea]
MKRPPIIEVEDYPSGYPQYAALIGSHASFNVYRRFLRLRARLLLSKQDKLSMLERELDDIDIAETRELFLGNQRRDRNQKRQDIIERINVALSDYDQNSEQQPGFLQRTDDCLDRNKKILAYHAASRNHISNLQNWTDNTSSIAQAETAYLSQSADLFTLTHSADDITFSRLAQLLERLLCRLYRALKKPQSPISHSPHIKLVSAPLLGRLTRSLVAWLVIVILLVPVAVVNGIESTAARMAVIVLASAGVIAALAGLTNARTVEMVGAGAT